MASKRETSVVDKLGDDSDEIIPFRYSISSYGADYPVDSLIKRMVDGNIYVPKFQRGYVWKSKQASRFIESLLLGLPVPGIFLSKEQRSQKLLVIDGQQRLRTLQFFHDGIFEPNNKKFALRGVQSKFNGLTYKTLSDDDKRRLNDSIIHATIIRQDEPSEDDSSVYYVFERLNTGGTLLQPQEIRASIYHGKFNDLLRKLNKNGSWRALYGAPSSRMRDQELILRFLSLFFRGQKYTKPMKEFLNKYMGKNRQLKLESETELSEAFFNTVELIHKYIGRKAFKPKRALNAAICDSVMVGLARRLVRGKIRNPSMIIKHYESLLANKKYLDVCETATADEENVSRRLELATNAFSSIR